MNRRSKLFFFLVLILVFSPFSPGKAQVKTGLELDILPYLTGGYFGAGWVGKGHVRARALIAQVNMPDFITPKGFTNHQIRS